MINIKIQVLIWLVFFFFISAFGKWFLIIVTAFLQLFNVLIPAQIKFWIESELSNIKQK